MGLFQFRKRLQPDSNQDTETNIGLALGGGGARGLCQIAFCQAMDELGVRPSIISGTSMGAIVGAFYAAGVSGQAMYDLLQQMGLRELSRLIDFSFFRKSSLIRGKAVQKFFWEHIPKRRFEELDVPLKVVATDYWRQQQMIFQQGDLIAAVRASMSVPGIFEPMVIGDMVLTDGGAVNPVPHDIIRGECDFLIAIDVTGQVQATRHAQIPSIFDSVMTTFQTMETSLASFKRQVYPVDLYVKPKLTNIGVLDFIKERLIFEMVRDDVELFKRQLHGALESL